MSEWHSFRTFIEGNTEVIHSYVQPRRVAATSIAQRVADEIGCTLGHEVGYSIRFEDVTSAKTEIKYLTDGMLLREVLVDPLLSRYSVIMVDEAHERSLSSDLLLGVLKKIRNKRPELRIIVSSATIQAEDFGDFFKGSPRTDGKSEDHDEESTKIVFLGGRMYPVDIEYLEQPTDDYAKRAVQTVLDIHKTEGEGDVLLFLTGREEIDTVVQELTDHSSYFRPHEQVLSILPLYAGLSTEYQMSVFEPAPENTRKVVVSTNIAEASVTIDGISFVVDCGFVKMRDYDPYTGIDTLAAAPISKASAIQRAGRAGRTRPGKCFRLYPESAYSSLAESTPPEIQRSNLAPVILQLKALGIENIARFDFLSTPPTEQVARGLELLYSLGALDGDAKLTRPLGSRMAELAVEPMMSKVLLSAPDFGCLSEMLSIAAMTSLQGAVWYLPDGEKKATDMARRKFAAEEGDHLTMLNIYHSFVTKGRKDGQWCHKNYLNFKSMTRAVSIRNQLRRYLERLGIPVDESLASRHRAENEGDIGERIRRCLTTGYFAHAAKMQEDGTLQTVDGGTTLHAHPSSLLFVSALLFALRFLCFPLLFIWPCSRT